jgi:hypothetical protein
MAPAGTVGSVGEDAVVPADDALHEVEHAPGVPAGKQDREQATITTTKAAMSRKIKTK